MKTMLFVMAALIFIFTNSEAQNSNRLIHFMQQKPSPATAVPYGANPKAGHYVQAGDARIYYEVYGKGRPVVILHGGVFGSIYEMSEFIDSLKKKFQVIAISTRGHGKSELGK